MNSASAVPQSLEDEPASAVLQSLEDETPSAVPQSLKINSASATAGRFLTEHGAQSVQLLPQKTQKPLLDGQVHPTASSKSYRHRIVKRI
jgi:hypothetical protein